MKHRITDPATDRRHNRGELLAIRPDRMEEGDDLFFFIAAEDCPADCDRLLVGSLDKRDMKPGLGHQMIHRDDLNPTDPEILDALIDRSEEHMDVALFYGRADIFRKFQQATEILKAQANTLAGREVYFTTAPWERGEECNSASLSPVNTAERCAMRSLLLGTTPCPATCCRPTVPARTTKGTLPTFWKNHGI